MNRRAVILTLVRLVAVYLGLLAVLLAWPGVWLRPAAPVAAAMAGMTSPYLSDVTAHVDERTIEFGGQVRIDMTLLDGSPLPALPGQWRKSAGQSLNILLVALPFWAATAMPRPRRIFSLCVTIVFALLATAYDLAVEADHAALHVIGTDWLPRYSMENTVANIEAFRNVEDRYRFVRHIKGFLDAGGRLFLGVLSAWLGFAVSSMVPAVRKVHHNAPR